MEITTLNYAEAAGIHEATVRRRLQDIPYRAGRGNCRCYDLPEALLTLKRSEVNNGAAHRLVEAASVPDDVLYVGADRVDVARRLIDLLPDEAADRFRIVKNLFFVSVSRSKLCVPTVVAAMADLADLLILQPDVLRFSFEVEAELDIDSISPAFALVNAGNTYKEAA